MIFLGSSVLASSLGTRQEDELRLKHTHVIFFPLLSFLCPSQIPLRYITYELYHIVYDQGLCFHTEMKTNFHFIPSRQA